MSEIPGKALTITLLTNHPTNKTSRFIRQKKPDALLSGEKYFNESIRKGEMKALPNALNISEKIKYYTLVIRTLS